MAFETVQITSTRNGVASITGWRQDLAIGDVVAMRLTDNTGVSSYRWELVGRPEGSVAGGAGPEPIILGVGATASFTVDSDAGLIRNGTYVVHCVLNGGTPTQAIVTVGLARLWPGLSFNGLPLRRLGGFESQEDTADALVRQGWAKMLNRWLGLLAGGGAVDAHDVKANAADAAPGFLDGKTKAGPGIALSVVNDAGIDKLQIETVGGGVAADWDITKVRYFFVSHWFGNDANVGYLDAAPGTVFLRANALAVAVKTTARLEALRPKFGAGRMMVTLFDSDPTRTFFDHAAPGDGLGRDWKHDLDDYSLCFSRGSDFTNSAADLQQLGMVPNADGPLAVVGTAYDTDGNPVITTVGVHTVQNFNMSRHRLRIDYADTSIAYAPLRYGEKTNMIADQHIIIAWQLSSPPPAGGDTVTIEEPGVRLASYTEVQVSAGRATVPFLGAAGMEIGRPGEAGDVIAVGANQPAQPPNYCSMVLVRPSLLIGNLTALGTFVSETGAAALSASQGISVESPDGALAGSADRVILCVFSRLWNLTAIGAPDLQLSACSTVSVILDGGQRRLHVLNSDWCDLNITPSGEVRVGGRWCYGLVGPIPAGIVIIPPASAAPSVLFEEMRSLYVPEPALPGITLKPGKYTVEFDHGDIGTPEIEVGSHVRLEFGPAATEFIPITYDSLRTTGFEIEGGQRVVSRMTGANYKGDVLPCPRGRVYRLTDVGGA